MRLPNQATSGIHRVSAQSGPVHAVAPSEVAQFNPFVQMVLPFRGLTHGYASQVTCWKAYTTVVPGIECWKCANEYGQSVGGLCFTAYPPNQ